MQIELIGCTGAGKSTLARATVRACRERGLEAWLGDDFLLERAKLGWARGHFLRTVLVDLLALIACLLTLERNASYYVYAVASISRAPEPWPTKLNLVRNVLKKVGIYEIVRRLATPSQFILVDEGTLHAAHNLLVHASGTSEVCRVPEFIRRARLPDVAVYVKAPEATLVERTVERGHSRIRDRSADSVARFVHRAVEVLDALAEQPELADRLIVVEKGSATISQTATRANPTIARAREVVEAGLAVLVAPSQPDSPGLATSWPRAGRPTLDGRPSMEVGSRRR